MTEARTDAVAPVSRPRSAEVTTVIVTRGATEYLEETLAGLASQTRSPQRILLVDAAPADDATDAEVRALVDALRPTLPVPVVVVAAPGARTFGHAVRTALATRAGDGGDTSGAPTWLWLLHDDSAPEPTALAELLRAVEAAPSVGVAGCKQRSWAGPVRVLEVGVATSRFGRRMTGLEEPEVDQGQHDGREDVLAVGLAGSLVRRDVWTELGGTDPALGPYGDGLDLCRRARLAGHRVVVVPRAVVRHAQASLARPIAGAVLNRPGWDARRSAQARREAYLHSQLTGVPAALVPVVALLALASSVVRALGRFVTKEPHLVLAELAAPWAVLGRPARVLSARRRAAATRRAGRRSLRPLQVTWRDVVRQERDRRLTAAERRRTRVAPSELELSELSALRSRRRGTLAVVVVLATALSWWVVGPLVTQVLAGARLTGGTLAFGDATLGDLWAAATSGWATAGFGHAAPGDPLLVALLPFTLLTGTVGGATAVLLLGSLVLAAVSAWFAAGAATRSVALRAWAALVWTASPALLLGVRDARLGAVVAHVLLPWVALGVARAVGAARVDVVESGLVGAQRVSGAAVTGPRTSPARTAEPSLAAAAGAGLAFALVVAGAPVLLPAGLLALAVVAVPARRRRRLVWVALPALVLQAPVILDAVAGWSGGGWRVLLADPGVVVASVAGPAWQQLLGWPTQPPAWVTLPSPFDAVVPWLLTGVVALLAVLALATGGRPGRAVRTAWLVVACGVLAALPARAVVVAVADGGSGAESGVAESVGAMTSPWAGPGTSLALLGLLAAALVGASGARAAMARTSFGWRQVAVAVLTVLAVVGPAAGLGAWAWHTRAQDDLRLAASDVPVVPAVGQQLQQSPDDVRVLELDVDAVGDVRATLLRYDGPQLTEVSRSVAVRELTGVWGDARPVGPDAADQELADAAARLTTGASGDAAADLANLGIGAVLVPDVEHDVSGEDSRATVVDAVIGRIDSTLGMERVTQTPSGVIWRVAAADLGTTAAWARLVDGDGGPDGALLASVPAADGVVDTEIEPGDGSRLLVLAERSGAGWQATLDGKQLRSVETSWRQAFEVGPEGGRLTVAHVPAGRTPWLLLQGVVLLVTVLLALPVRRRRGGAR